MPLQLLEKNEVAVALATGVGVALKYVFDGARNAMKPKAEKSELEHAVALLAEAMRAQTRLLEKLSEDQKAALQLINRVDVKVDALRLDAKSH